MLVPVNPVCPNELGAKRSPAEEPVGDFVSQPNALLLPSDCFLVNIATVTESKYRLPPYVPPFISICKNFARSSAVEKSPA